MNNWDEVRTAYHVARAGTVSGAAAALGVHHATVIRHIDALEARLGTRLFQRHARGYTPTEAGEDLLVVAQTTEDQMAQLESRLRGRGNEVAGEMVVTSLPGMGPLMAPVLASFRRKHPGVMVRYLTSERVFRLEYGEAHVAIRAGSTAEEPDNIVQAFATSRVGLYAARDYVDRMGMPEDETDLARHEFVVYDDFGSRAPFYRWLYPRVGTGRAAYRCSENQAITEAIRAGAGLGFMALWSARRYPDLVQVMAPRPEWAVPFRLVTHMDLHRTAKVQAFLKHLKAEAAAWDL